MADINRSLVITYKQIFGRSNTDYLSDISLLDKTTWFRVLARFNFLLRNEEKYSVVKVLSMWFREGNNEYANDLYKKIQTAYGKSVDRDPSITTLNLWTNLTLLDEILKRNGQDREGDELETERRLFNAYLAVNERYGELSDRITQELGKVTKGQSGLLEWLAKATLTSLLPYNDIVNSNVADLLMTQFVKACICFEYFERDHPELLKLYLQKYGIESWREYIKAIMPVVKHAVMHSEGGLSYLSIKHSEDAQKTKMFLDSLSLSSDVIYEVKTDFIHARSSPLFKIDNETYLVIDQVLIINKMYNSIFFEMFQLLKDNKISVRPYKDFFQLYTAQFIENFLSYKLLNRMSGKRQLYHLSGYQIKERFGVDTEPDYYIRNGNKVFLCEIKGSIITGDAKQSFSYANVERELKRKYYQDDDGDKKAVLQLIERLELLFSDAPLYDQARKPNSLRIYPILLVSETAMLTPGVNYLINRLFREKIEENDKLKGRRIHDLVIMDINSLILYNDQFKNNTNLLNEMIEGYERQTSPTRMNAIPKNVRTTDQVEKIGMSVLIPFTLYLKQNIRVEAPSMFFEYVKAIFPEDQD